MRLALELAKARQVGEARVQEVACRRRDERQRIALGKRGIGHFERRVVERQRIYALLFQPLAVELALAARRREAALGEGRKALGHREALPAVALERLPVGLAGERRAADVFVAVAEARLIESHARCEA